jgi:hypothetical protein
MHWTTMEMTTTVFERMKKPSQQFPFIALKEIATANPKSLELKQGHLPE